MTICINYKYTRVEILLPVTKREEKAAAQKTINFIKSDLIPGTKQHRYEGMTYSATNNPIFKGEWLHPRKKVWILDKEAILILDLIFSYRGQQKIEQELEHLKSQAAQYYNNHSAHQDEIWVIAHPIGRAETV